MANEAVKEAEWEAQKKEVNVVEKETVEQARKETVKEVEEAVQEALEVP